MPSIAALTYLVLGLLLLKYYQYITYKDEVNYISIAQRLAAGDFLNAPNAYWNPLLPALLAVLIVLGVPAALGAKLLCLGIGVFAFFSVRSLSYALEMSEGIRKLLLFILVPILLNFSLEFFTPDLLLVALLSLYFSFILTRKYVELSYAGLLCGGLGALSYLAKPYAFSFFLVHFTLFNVFYYFRNNQKATKRLVLRQFAFGLVVFFLVTAGWVYLLNRKYHEITVGISASYNYKIRSPDLQPLGPPSSYAGLVPPRDDKAYSIWEEPYYFYERANSWSPLDSLRAFRQQLKLIRDSVENMAVFHLKFSVFSLPIVLAAILLCIHGARKSASRPELLLMLLTFGLYSAGYALIYSEERYIWPMQILILLMGGHVIHLLFQTALVKHVLILLFSASFMIHPFMELAARANKGRSVYLISESLKNEGLNGAKIASNRDYGASVCVAYYTNARYYGQKKPKMSEEEMISELKKFGINYYLVWDKAATEKESLKKVKEVTVGARSLVVYSVQP